MSYFLKLSAYVFLALMGLSAWQAYSGGWRYYLGIVLFMVCVLRILMLVRQRMPGARPKGTPEETPPPQAPDDTDDTPGPALPRP